MASKSRTMRLESEIEKYRSDANWTKALDFAKQISNKGSSFEVLGTFVQCESNLERYLLENPANEENIGKARENLSTIQRQFVDITVDHHVKGNMKQEAHLLLGKILFAMGDYQAALAKYDEISLDTITVQNASNRKLQLVGEAYAIKGLCLEKIPPDSTSKFKLAEREESIIRCFEKSGDISLVQLQNQQETGREGSLAVALKASGNWNVLDSESTAVGPVVETAIQRSPILYIRNGELSKGIGRFRELLCVVETRAFQNLRQTLARQLAEVLLRGVCRSTYKAISRSSFQRPANGPVPRIYEGDSLFCPQDQCEETLLLLLISESIASREALLNRSAEYIDARLHTFHSATAVYDLLTIALVRHAQYNLLTETFERAMKFSFDEFHIWYQFALSLISAQKYTRGYLVLKECLRLDPRNTVVQIQAAKLCYEHLELVAEGIEHCSKALEIEENPMVSRCYVFLGIGHSLQDEQCRLRQQKEEYQRKALKCFQRATAIDPHDYLAQFHLARQLAECRQIGAAMKHAHKALKLRGEHMHSQHLLALLLSAQNQHEAALQLVDSILTEHPDNFNILLSKSKLEESVHGVETALQTCKHMLRVWKKVFEPIGESDTRGTGLIHKIASDQRSLVQLPFSDYSDRDSPSIKADSVAASKIEQTLSEAASSPGSYMTVRPGHQFSWGIQTQIWLHLAETFLNMGSTDSARACINEAASIHPLSHTVCYMRGRLLEYQGDLQGAKQFYENAISINPVHAKSLQYLGGVLHKEKNYRMAEKVLRNGVSCDATSSTMWARLGNVLDDLNDHERASQCHVTALQLEDTNPVVSFSVIPKVLC